MSYVRLAKLILHCEAFPIDHSMKSAMQSRYKTYFIIAGENAIFISYLGYSEQGMDTGSLRKAAGENLDGNQSGVLEGTGSCPPGA